MPLDKNIKFIKSNEEDNYKNELNKMQKLSEMIDK